MRAFVALALPEALIGSLLGLQAGLPFGRAVAPENLHLTLTFLGDIEAGQAGDLAESLAGLALPGLDLRLHGLELLGPAQAPVLAALAEGEGLMGVHDKVQRAARQAGIDLRRRRFRPHVTIARFGRLEPGKVQRLADFMALNGAFSAGPAPVADLVLYRSHLASSGTIYEPLAEFRLGRAL